MAKTLLYSFKMLLNKFDSKSINDIYILTKAITLKASCRN